MKYKRFIPFLTALFFVGQSALADGVPLLRASGFITSGQEAEMLSKDDAQRIKKIRSFPETRRATVVSIDSSALLSNVTTLAIPGDGVIRVSKSGGERLSATDGTWHGKTESGGEVTVASSGQEIHAIIREAGRVFEIRNLGGKLHVFIEIDPRRLPAEHPPEHPSGAVTKPSSSVKPSKDGEPTTRSSVTSIPTESAAGLGTPNINVLVAYTPQAKAFLGNISSAIQTAVAEMNQSFSNSGVNLHVTVVAQTSVPVDYPTSQAALDGVINALPVLIDRDNSNADLVILLGHFSDYCGLAKEALASPSTAFASVADRCLITSRSFAHEIGHLMGAQHNVGYEQGFTPYSYGHGYAGMFNDPYQGGTTRVCWHTIMSYESPPSSGCFTDPRINYWSNPAVTHTAVAGNPHPTGVAGVSNVAAVLNLTGPSVATLRNTKLAGALSAVSNVILNMFLFTSFDQ